MNVLSRWIHCCNGAYILFFKRFYLFNFRERVREGERGEKHWFKRLLLVHAPTGDQTCNPDVGLDQKSKWWPYALWDNAQPTEPHWSEQSLHPCGRRETVNQINGEYQLVINVFQEIQIECCHSMWLEGYLWLNGWRRPLWEVAFTVKLNRNKGLVMIRSGEHSWQMK